MSMELSGVTSQLINLALDAAALRHEIAANNIANYDTPGYRAKRLNFESYLNDMTVQLERMGDEAVISRLDTIRSYMEDGSTVSVSKDESVELDREMVRLTENALRYQALLKAAAKHGEILRLAISGGRK